MEISFTAYLCLLQGVFGADDAQKRFLYARSNDVFQLKFTEIAVIVAVPAAMSAGEATACRREPGIPLVDVPVPVSGAAGRELSLHLWRTVPDHCLQ